MTSQRYLKQGLPRAPTVEKQQGDVASTPGNAWILNVVTPQECVFWGEWGRWWRR